MTRPKLLDLFCGAGGAAMGYHRAGFDVVGVDIEPQPHYPFEFVQADAMTYPLDGFAAIHASPPCQHFTQMNAAHRARAKLNRPDLLTPTRARLRVFGKPYVIENVSGAKDSMAATLILHGGMFGMRIHRPRLFESSELILAPRARVTKHPIGVYGDHPEPNGRTRLNGDMSGKRSVMRIARTLAEAQEVMGMPWADWHGCKEAIPPAYTEYIGAQLLAAIGAAA